MSKAPFSNEAFRDFALTKNEEKYHYTGCFSCAIAQYLKYLGVNRPIVGETTWTASSPIEFKLLPKGWNKAVLDEPRTFKALAERLL